MTLVNFSFCQNAGFGSVPCDSVDCTGHKTDVALHQFYSDDSSTPALSF